MASTGEEPTRKLFKYYLDETVKLRDNRPLFFRRNMRWRSNSREYGYIFSKRGIFRGYIKYGVFTYMAYYYSKALLFPEHHGHGHGHGEHGHGHAEHGHGDSHGHGHGHSEHAADHHHEKTEAKAHH